MADALSRPAGTAAVETEARWASAISLGGLHGAVSLAWVAYNLYLVQLLVRAGFDAYLATVVLTVEGVLGAVLEPVFGNLSDDTRRGLFRRFFLLTAGVVLASLLFLVLPLAAVSARPGPATLVPGLLVGWAFAMTVFRAPALSLLGRRARPGALPLAASALTAAGALVGAASPAARSWLLGLGPLVTFAIASAALVVAALVVRTLEAAAPVAPAAAEDPPAPLDARAARAGSLLFAVGTTTGLAFRFLLDGLPRAAAGPGTAASTLTTTLFLGTALASVPLGRLALGRPGGGAVTLGGLAVLALGATAPVHLQAPGAILGCAALLGAGLAALQNGLFAASLTAVRPDRGGLGMGLLLGGGGLALGAFNLLLAVRRPAPETSLLVAAGLYALGAVLMLGLRGAGRPAHP